VSLKSKFTLTILSLLASFNINAAPLKPPTLILVHGALFTSSSWIAVQSYLQENGYNVVTMDVPGRADDGEISYFVTLSKAVDKLCKVVSAQSEPVVLVGHSQGGAIITQALDRCADKIKALVYVAAVAPLNGEAVFDALSQEDNDNFGQCATLDKMNDVYNINYNGPIREMFMADASPEQVKWSINNMVPEPSRIGDATLYYPEKIFRAMPKYYIETTNDKIISLATQKKIEANIKPDKVYSIISSHSPFLTHPRWLSTYLIEIANSQTGRGNR
jgi:pimeloyl-ACP methyl ester carboxylesterase